MNHNFTYLFDPDLPPEQQKELAVTQAFYVANMYHDLLYQLGFKESDGNFQVYNGNRGGDARDPMFVYVQTPEEINNAAFVGVPGDGEVCGIKLYLWTERLPY